MPVCSRMSYVPRGQDAPAAGGAVRIPPYENMKGEATLRRFTTPTQWKILKYFWRRQSAFSVDDLIDAGIIHFPALGRFTLRIMEARGQVISLLTRKSGTLYFATTRSKEEWRGIWVPNPFPDFVIAEPSSQMRGVNRYEFAAIMEKLDRMFADIRKEEDALKALERNPGSSQKTT